MGAFILLISGAIKGFRGNKSNDDDSSKSLAILKQRYSNGEIEKEEYEEKYLDLTNLAE